MPDHHLQENIATVPEPRHSLFFAAVPPPEIKDRITQAWQAFGTGDKFRDDKLHLSIYAVAEVQELDLILLQRARQAPKALRTAPFTLAFSHLAGFDSNALVLATEEKSPSLNELSAELRSACRAMGLPQLSSNRPTPHVTCAYGPAFPGRRPIGEPILWTIDEITLIDSLQGRNHYDHLGTWLLPRDRAQKGFDF